MFGLILLLFSTFSFAAQVQVAVPAGADLGSILSKSPGNTLYTLAAKSNYTLTVPISVSKPFISVNLNGSNFSSTYGGSSLAIHGANFEIYNGNVLYAGTFIRSYAANTYVHNIVVPSNRNDSTKVGVFQFFLADVGGVSAKLDSITCNYTDTVAVYVTQDNFTLTNSKFTGSYGEDTIRFDIAAAGAANPKNILIDHLEVDNKINSMGKEALSLRMSGPGSIIRNSTIHWYMRLGQTAAAGAPVIPLGSTGGGVTIQNNVFDLNSPTEFQRIAIHSGVIATVSGNTFYANTNHPPLSIDAISSANLVNNVMKNLVAGIKVHAFWSGSSTMVKESGTINN